MTDPRCRVDDMLSSCPPEPRNRSVIDDNPDLIAALERFFELKRAGKAHVSFGWFYRQKLREAFDGPHERTVRDFIRNRLKIDPTTGRSLDG
jgi:hypothetical protein